MVEVVLMFTASTLDPGGHAITLGRSSAPEIVRFMRDALLAEAADEVVRWRSVDPVLGEMRAAEAEKLAKLLAVTVPDAVLTPHLELVERDE